MPARSYLSSSEYILAYSSLTSSKLLAFPSSRLKVPMREVRARVIKGKIRPFGSLLPGWFREPQGAGMENLDPPRFKEHFSLLLQDMKGELRSVLVTKAKIRGSSAVSC